MNKFEQKLLQNKINELREDLNKLIEHPLSKKEEIIKISKKLDCLINIWYMNVENQ